MICERGQKRLGVPRDRPRRNARGVPQPVPNSGKPPASEATSAHVRTPKNKGNACIAHERAVKPSTLVGYRSTVLSELIPAFGEKKVTEITAKSIERWRGEQMRRRQLSARSMNKATTIMSGIFKRAGHVWPVPSNPVDHVDKLREPVYDDLNFYEPEEIWALVRAADHFDPTGQDGALFLTLGFAGLRRGEAIALTWRDVDFERESIRVRGNWSYGQLVTTNGGRIRSVPLVPQLAQRLAQLGQRENFSGPDEPLFVNEFGQRIDGSALRRRYLRAREKAELRPLRLHDLRHAFASLAIDHASPVEVQAWAGHQDARTTARYTHYKSRKDEARRLAKAFDTRLDPPMPGLTTPSGPKRGN